MDKVEGKTTSEAMRSSGALGESILTKYSNAAKAKEMEV